MDNDHLVSFECIGNILLPFFLVFGLVKFIAKRLSSVKRKAASTSCMVIFYYLLQLKVSRITEGEKNLPFLASNKNYKVAFKWPTQSPRNGDFCAKYGHI